MLLAQGEIMKKSKINLLIEASFQGEEFTDIVNKASLVLNNPLVIISNSYNIISYSTTFPVDDTAWVNATKRGYITLEFGATLNNWNNHVDTSQTIDCITVSTISKYTRRFFKLIYKNKLMGYLNVTDVNNYLNKIDDETYQLVANIIAKEIAFTHTDNLNRTTSFEEILLELSNENFINKLHFLDRISSSKINIHKEYQIACIDLKNFTSYNAREDTFKNEIFSFFSNGSIIINNQLLIILCDLSKNKKNNFNARLETYLKKKNLVMGISDIFHDLFEFKRFEIEATMSIQLRSLLLKEESFIFYNQVKHYDLIMKFDENQLSYYCNQKLFQIYLEESNESNDYIKTLRTYLETNNSVKETADLLFIHRNTVNYRILKIKELLGIDNSQALLANELLFSCYILQIIHAKRNHLI